MRPLRSWMILLPLGILFFLPEAVEASTGGPSMPWDTGLTNLVDNLTGTVARLLVIAAIVVAGLTWAFTEHGTGGRKISQIVFGAAVALGAAQFLTALGITGALL